MSTPHTPLWYFHKALWKTNSEYEILNTIHHDIAYTMQDNIKLQEIQI